MREMTSAASASKSSVATSRPLLRDRVSSVTVPSVTDPSVTDPSVTDPSVTDWLLFCVCVCVRVCVSGGTSSRKRSGGRATSSAVTVRSVTVPSVIVPSLGEFRSLPGELRSVPSFSSLGSAAWESNAGEAANPHARFVSSCALKVLSRRRSTSEATASYSAPTPTVPLLAVSRPVSRHVSPPCWRSFSRDRWHAASRPAVANAHARFDSP